MSKTDILEQLPKLPSEDRQEILDRLCELQEAEAHDAHQGWVDEALRSGPARPATPEDWAGAVRRWLESALKRPRRDLSPPGIRSLIVCRYPRYLLFHRWHGDTVEILRVKHGMMDLHRLFSDRPSEDGKIPTSPPSCRAFFSAAKRHKKRKKFGEISRSPAA